jgi:hypothetical protein
VTAWKLEWALLGTVAVTTFGARWAAEKAASPAAEKSAAPVGGAEIRERCSSVSFGGSKIWCRGVMR